MGADKKQFPGKNLQISVNGKREVFDETVATLDDLLNYLQIDGMRVAVAVNEACVPKGLRSQQTLNDGDRVEILAPMVGG